MAVPLQVWVCRLPIPPHLGKQCETGIDLTCSVVDLGGSLAVASKGLFATGVSTDLNGTLSPSPMYLEDAERRFGLTYRKSHISIREEGLETYYELYVKQAWKDENNIVEELAGEERDVGDIVS
ncbi:MAG: hypothetical protein Q9170_003281 [Blastenia crenularia]